MMKISMYFTSTLSLPQVALVYMSTRLIVNLTQVYTPLYLVDSLKLEKNSVAIGPLVIYVSGFIMTLLLKVINRFIGRYVSLKNFCFI